jgi:hypothetical protein
MNSNKKMRYQVILLVHFKDREEMLSAGAAPSILKLQPSSNQSQSAKTNESTMDIKHASVCVVQNFLSFF